MNEEILKQYVDFINILFAASSSEEITAIVKNNCILIDEEIFPVIDFAIEQLIEDKDIESAKWLQDFARQLEEELSNFHQLNQNSIQLYQNGRYTEAIEYAKSALKIAQNIWLDDHPDLANCLNNLGYLLQIQGKITEAEPYYRNALAMYQRLFPEDHPDVASSLNNLGYLLEAQGKVTEAEPYYRDALAMYQMLFPKEHPKIASSLNNVGYLLQAQGKVAEALAKFIEAVTVESNLTSRIFAFSSEADRIHHLDSIKITTNSLLSLVVTHFFNDKQAIQNVFDIVLQRKSLSSAALAAFNSVIYEERYQHLQEQLQQWRSLGEQIFYFTFNQNKPEDKGRVAQLKQKANRLEKVLTSQVLEIQLQNQEVNRQTIAEQLRPHSVLLEFARFSLYESENHNWGSLYYVVFILPAGRPNKVEMKILGEAAEIEELIELTRLCANAYVCYIDSELQLVRFDGKELAIDFHKFSRSPSQVKPETIPDYPYVLNIAIQLRQKIFDPISEYLEDCKQIFISPDASLNLVPFGILPLDETGEELLSDRYQISYLSAGRDLFRSIVSTNRPASEPLVIADPKFLLGESDSNTISQNQNSDRNSPLTPDSQLIKVLDEEHLSRAETTGLLAEKVAAMLGVKPYLQKDALVSHLKRNKCPRILLIGTHGLYCPLSEAQQNAIAHQDRDRLSSLPQATNPMIRSGLAFAGATNWQKNLPLPPEAGNGYLMAQDVAQLDLWANEITVLLACNSAIGDVHQGEGVFGLRRAFAVAGAKTLIMSLWSVPEKASALLMERFFNNLQQKMGRNAALQEAQNYIRFITVEQLRQSDLGLEVLKELTGNRKFDSETLVEDESCQPLKHPFYWGAWICQGETTPFDIEFG